MKTLRCFIFTFLFTILVAPLPIFAQEELLVDRMVRLVYLLPNDREAQPDIDTELDASIKRTQEFFADEMARHGLGRKTFRFETNDDGNAIVYHVAGKYNDEYYLNDSFNKIFDELEPQFDFSNNIYVIAVELSSGTFDGAVCGIGGNYENGGYVLVPASGHCTNNVALIPHELGHAFGLQHYFFNAAAIMSYGAVREDLSSKQLSLCNAHWLSVHPYFNADKAGTPNLNTSIQPVLAEFDAKPPHAFRLRFELNDPDGLHQAQLIATKSAALNDSSEPEFIDCQTLSGVSAHAEFATTRILDYVLIQVIDKEGNYTRIFFRIDSTVPPTETQVVSIPDPNLAAAIREALGHLPRQQITTFEIARLQSLTATNRGITDLTGLEHAVAIEYLDLWNNQIQDITPLSSLQQLRELYLGSNLINDTTPVSRLMQITILSLSENRISDITPLANLTQLTTLRLSNPLAFDGADGQFKAAPGYNEIQDITPLANLTQLIDLGIIANQLSDITPLANLTQLERLELGFNQIQDITALKDLIHLENLVLQENQISDIRPLKRLVELKRLYLDNNNEIDDITALQDMTKLRQLQLTNSKISDLTPLSRLTGLYELNMSECQISDITPLTDMTQLRSLTLFYNQIVDITPIADMTQLYELGLGFNQIVDTKPLAKLIQLQDLRLQSNQIIDVHPITSMVNLNYLYIWENPITDLQPLLTLKRRNPDIEIYHIRRGEPLPVTLSSFKATRTADGVILNWITESEVDNAGFYIYRSQTKAGEFKVVTPTMIQGAGATAQRTEYTWTDTTAKPNTVYYYRIEDVSHAGVRQTLTTTRLRGLISAKGKMITHWAAFKNTR